jgi:hypothetical protein
VTNARVVAFDRLAPRAHGHLLADRLLNATFDLVPGQGHLLYDAWRNALAWAVA